MVTAGVPQGSVLGPLLFLGYINDLTHNIPCNMKLFVDDSSIFTHVEEIQGIQCKIERNLRNISTWAHLRK